MEKNNYLIILRLINCTSDIKKPYSSGFFIFEIPIRDYPVPLFVSDHPHL